MCSFLKCQYDPQTLHKHLHVHDHRLFQSVTSSVLRFALSHAIKQCTFDAPFFLSGNLFLNTQFMTATQLELTFRNDSNHNKTSG